MKLLHAMRQHVLVVAALVASLGGGPPRSVQQPQPVHESNVATPTRDGIQLRADIQRPAGSGRFPTLVYRTPYGKDAADPVVNPYDGAGAHDYQSLAERDDVLTFDSPPLASDLAVAGPVRARMFISCDCRDTDLWVHLLDVAPDGRAYNVMSPGIDAVRASYRDLSRGRQLLDPGTIYEIRLDHLVTANVLREEHRIRVQVSSTFFPNFSRNLHTGELESASARTKTATIRVHHDREHPSQISVHVADQ